MQTNWTKIVHMFQVSIYQSTIADILIYFMNLAYQIDIQIRKLKKSSRMP